MVNLLRSKWLAVLVHISLWTLLAVILAGFGGVAPEYRDVTSYSLPAQSLAPVSRIDQLLASTNWPAHVLNTNLPSPFYTTAFIPVPKGNPPPPPAPTTRKVILVYQGYFSTDNGPRTAMLKMADRFATVPLGSAVVTNHYIIELTHKSMTLTNTAGHTNLLLLNTAQELEIPIK